VKKARYAFAVLGAAPALGMMAPAAIAAPATTHAPARPAKTVRLGHTATPALHAGTSSPATSPQYTCHPGTPTGGWSKNHLFLFDIVNYGHCVDAQHGLLEVRQPGLSERVRGYSQYGQMAFWRRVGETLGNSYTLFPSSDFSSLNWNPVYQICAALVAKGTNSVYYGPVCLNP
jgi:hypothetical protein